MASSISKRPFLKKWRVRIVLWIIFFVLLCIFMLYVFFKESKEEEDYQKHINAEHHNTV
jgi:uncharacterized ion transporter superfamily protein YfcC